MKDALIVTRHQGLVEWLRRNGVEGEVVTHVDDPEMLRGKDVYGMLPYNLGALAKSVTIVSLPSLKLEQRGKDLTPEEMDAAGATLETFSVTRIPPF
jgi:putative CRISPR-associated protein (TIGR02620 family)